MSYNQGGNRLMAEMKKRNMRVVVANDHAGQPIRDVVFAALKGLGCEVIDLGVEKQEPRVDYPEMAVSAASMVLEGKADRAILMCGSGVGMAITANRYQGIRAAVCCGYADVRIARAHGNINVLCLAAKMSFKQVTTSAIRAFINTPFSEEERYQRRVNQIDQLTE